MNVLYALRRAKQFHADSLAILDAQRSFTYRQFAERVERAANALRDMGVQRGDRVAVLLLNSPAYLELYHATALAGAIIVPINIRWNVEDILFSLKDSGSRL